MLIAELEETKNVPKDRKYCMHKDDNYNTILKNQKPKGQAIKE